MTGLAPRRWMSAGLGLGIGTSTDGSTAAERHIIHRDLKTENAFHTRQGTAAWKARRRPGLAEVETAVGEVGV